MQQGDMKESWKTINQLFNKRSKITNIESLKDDKSNDIVDKQETMNKIFCSIGKDLAKNIKEKPNPLISGEYQINNEGKTLDLGQLVSRTYEMQLERSRLQRVLAMTISQAISSS